MMATFQTTKAVNLIVQERSMDGIVLLEMRLIQVFVTNNVEMGL